MNNVEIPDVIGYKLVHCTTAEMGTRKYQQFHGPT
jgi:hypothetical protein